MIEYSQKQKKDLEEFFSFKVNNMVSVWEYLLYLWNFFRILITIVSESINVNITDSNMYATISSSNRYAEFIENWCNAYRNDWNTKLWL